MSEYDVFDVACISCGNSTTVLIILYFMTWFQGMNLKVHGQGT